MFSNIKNCSSSCSGPIPAILAEMLLDTHPPIDPDIRVFVKPRASTGVTNVDGAQVSHVGLVLVIHVKFSLSPSSSYKAHN